MSGPRTTRRVSDVFISLTSSARVTPLGVILRPGDHPVRGPSARLAGTGWNRSADRIRALPDTLPAWSRSGAD